MRPFKGLWPSAAPWVLMLVFAAMLYLFLQQFFALMGV